MIIPETIAVAFSMFSAIPMPHVEWNEQNMRYSLLAFPLIGLVIGLCCRAWLALCIRLSLPAFLRGAGFCLLPILITGGIHLDGYADTCDALASHSDAEKKQLILKDPHIGAFAAIRLCIWFVADYALCASLTDVKTAALLSMFGLSRSLSALALTSFPLREGSGLARSFAEASDRKRVKTVLAAMTAAFALVLCFAGAGLAAFVCLPLFLYYRWLCLKRFGGLSGDLAGWFLQKAEIWMLAMMVLSEILGASF